MNNFDGWIFTIAGMILLLDIVDMKTVCMVGGVTGLSSMGLLLAYAVYYKCKSDMCKPCKQ